MHTYAHAHHTTGKWKGGSAKDNVLVAIPNIKASLMVCVAQKKIAPIHPPNYQVFKRKKGGAGEMNQ